jgi:D-arabinose 1-dehydrogenase-like Zn-dependent alcohol dehydrogenase
LSHTPGKKEEALKLGADHFVCTKDKDWAKPLAFTFDFILNAADMTNEYISSLSPPPPLLSSHLLIVEIDSISQPTCPR